MNFDLANACLGFVNGMQLAAMMIDAGRIDYALIVDGEGAREIHENTIARLARPDATREDVLSEFATLTLGSGAAAMVLGRADEHPEGHRLVGGVAPRRDRAPRAVHRRPERHEHRHQGLLDAGMAISDAVERRPGRLRLGGHRPLRRPPGLAGPHRGDVPDGWASTRAGCR